MTAIGTCAKCKGDVVFVYEQEAGFRFCLKCADQGVNVVTTADSDVRCIEPNGTDEGDQITVVHDLGDLARDLTPTTPSGYASFEAAR